MSPNAESLLEAALALPDRDRLEIAEALSASVQSANQPPFDESWKAIIQRRSQEIESGDVETIPWSEVKRQVREELGG